MNISLVEYAVLNCPEGMEGWRMYRIEYGGHAQYCLVEGTIWLPSNVDAREFEKYMGALLEEEDVR